MKGLGELRNASSASIARGDTRPLIEAPGSHNRRVVSTDAMALKICIAQLNFLVADTAGNAQKIIAAARAAYAQGARLVLTPELSICGYLAEDLFLRPAFIASCDDAVKTVARELAGLKGLHVVVWPPDGRRHSQQVRGRAAPLQRGQRDLRGPRAGDVRQTRAAQLPGVRSAPATSPWGRASACSRSKASTSACSSARTRGSTSRACWRRKRARNCSRSSTPPLPTWARATSGSNAWPSGRARSTSAVALCPPRRWTGRGGVRRRVARVDAEGTSGGTGAGLRGRPVR